MSKSLAQMWRDKALEIAGQIYQRANENERKKMTPPAEINKDTIDNITLSIYDYYGTGDPELSQATTIDETTIEHIIKCFMEGVYSPWFQMAQRAYQILLMRLYHKTQIGIDWSHMLRLKKVGVIYTPGDEVYYLPYSYTFYTPIHPESIGIMSLVLHKPYLEISLKHNRVERGWNAFIDMYWSSSRGDSRNSAHFPTVRFNENNNIYLCDL